MTNVGIDLVEHDRIKDKLDKLKDRLLSDEELVIFNNFKIESRKIEYLASRFAGKEAIFKVFKHGDGTLNFKDISILNNTDGSPYIKCDKIASKLEISISHTLNYSIAIVIKN